MKILLSSLTSYIDKLLQDLFGVLETPFDFGIASYQLIRHVVGTTLPVLIDVCDVAFIGSQENLGVVVKDNLDSLVTQTEENSVFGSHPFLHVSHVEISFVVIFR